MPLFDIPKRNISREKDSMVARRSKTTNKATITVKGGGSLFSKIATIKSVVDKYLGKYKDDYMLITDESVLHEYINKCIRNKYVSIDTETDGLDPILNKLAGVCLYTRGEKAVYIPMGHISYITQVPIQRQLSNDVVINEMQRLLANHVYIDMFNAKFDIRVLRHAGLKDIYCDWDGYIASMLLNENDPSHGLKKLHQKYVLKSKEDEFAFDELFKGVPFTYIPLNTAYLYAAHDPIVTTELADYQRKYLSLDSDREDLRNMAWVMLNIEMPCIPVVADMEDNGVLFNKEYAEELSVKYHKILDEKFNIYCDECNKYAKEIAEYRASHIACKLDDPINIASPVQLAILFYDIIKVGVIDEKTPRGTGEEILKKINNPISNAILEYRTISKLLTTYIDKLPNCVNPNDGRIHCSFNQYGAQTGRFSSQNPNLQNIPSRNHDIRKMFVASPGCILMSSDFSQQEPKVMTQMCQDAKMIKAYQQGKDLYAEIASLSFNKPYEDCLEFRPDGSTNPEGKERRSRAKSILLGVLYGRGTASIAEQLNTSIENAQKIKDSVFKGFPAIPKFEADSVRMAKEKGYVTTLWGRKRRLPEMRLPEYEFEWVNGTPPDDDLIDFDNNDTPINMEVPDNIVDYYWNKLDRCGWRDKRKVIAEAREEGIKIINNGGKIADATRQCVNARIQGSAADMSKLAMIAVGNDERLKELGFKLLIPVHDELIAECPMKNAKECKQRFAYLMSHAAGEKLTIPIKCDVSCSKEWYGEEIEV